MTRGLVCHAFPPNIPVVGEGAICKNNVFSNCVHRHGIGIVRRPGSYTEETVFGINGMKAAVSPDFHPCDIISDAFTLPARDSRAHHCQVCLSACRGKGGCNMILFSLRTCQTKNEHVFSH